MKWLKGCGLAALILLVIVVGAGILINVTSDRAPESASGADTPEATATPVPANADPPTATPEPETVTAQQLMQDFRDNEIRGDQLHKGQIKSVTGRVDEIRDDGSGYYVRLGFEGEAWDFGQVRCQLSDPEQAVTLRTGEAVTVRGRIEGLGLFDVVTIEDCTVEP